MRVINDKEKQTESADLGFFGMVGHAFLISIGMASVLLAPMPMIVAHQRLTEPWSKLACVIGALLAVVGLIRVELPVALLCFVFGLFVADSISREKPFFVVLVGALLVSLITGSLTLVLAAQWSHADVMAYALGLARDWASLWQQSPILKSDPAAGERLLHVFWHQGIFTYLTASALSFWLAIGICAHFRWLPEAHAYGVRALRKIKFPKVLSACFFIFGTFLVAGVGSQDLAEGAFRLFGTLLLIPGSLLLSEVFSKRKLKLGARTVLYSLALTFGFYVVVGLGAVRPWIPAARKTRIQEDA